MRPFAYSLLRAAPGGLAFPAIALCAVLAGCTSLQAPATDSVNVYLLDAQPVVPKAAALRRNEVLAVGTMRARAGFETSGIAYVTQPHELAYFAKSRWADAPARMLAPLIARALDQCGAFRDVVYNSGAVSADLRLDTELVYLQHEFIGEPSRVRLTLRAQLVDLKKRRVIAMREIEEVEPAAAANAYAGVEAANRALQRALVRLVAFSVDAL
jgi:cholesterol transport system auxiliary component